MNNQPVINAPLVLPAGKKIYFASDFHFGIPDHASSLQREKRLVRWLKSIEHDAFAIYLMGDIFDFWFEYGTVIPKGFTRLLGTLAQFTDNGIAVHVFRGNHDMWTFNYFTIELGIVMHRAPEIQPVNGVNILLAHGDGLGPGDRGYKFIKAVFENRVNQFLFNWLHPDLGTRMGLYFSHRSRHANIARENQVGKSSQHDPCRDRMLAYCHEVLSEGFTAQYFVFGHRHEMFDIPVNDSHMVVLGDWIRHFSYAEFDGRELRLQRFEAEMP